jgi:hypothetical protein
VECRGLVRPPERYKQEVERPSLLGELEGKVNENEDEGRMKGWKFKVLIKVVLFSWKVRFKSVIMKNPVDRPKTLDDLFKRESELLRIRVKNGDSES